MDLMRFMPNWRRHDADDTPAEERRNDAPKHGPRKVRYFTNGQMRRMVVRQQKAQTRKANRRFRRQWMANQQAVANLRGQLQVVGAIPFYDPDVVVSQDAPLHKACVKVLVERYGGVAEALEHYQAIEAERAA